jgi:hypothetical protein
MRYHDGTARNSVMFMRFKKSSRSKYPTQPGQIINYRIISDAIRKRGMYYGNGECYSS